MDTKQQTKVTDQNKSDFFLRLYHHQTATKKELVNIDALDEHTVILVDCCGWHYKKLFPNKSIVSLETYKTVKEFALDRTYFDRLIDNQSDDQIGWPSLSVDNCAVIFDRSPLLKYRTLNQISNILQTVAHKYTPNTILLKQSLTFIDDTRLVDRFYNIVKLEVNGYIVTQFAYDTHIMHLSIKFQKKHKLI